ncbi:hypothetical protein [Shivajiella indica]|uniref:Anti-sigma factor n=1 Tax=Shivajiella indica TaxID=872115 RepID=A0ABW5B5U3_9BACT
MKSRIEELLDKYWEGETSLTEEKELKLLLQESEGFESEKSFFLGISKIRSEKTNKIIEPTPKAWEYASWMKMAAALLLLLVSGWAVYDNHKKQAEKEAFEQVMQAFNLIQTNMEKGTQSLQHMEEFKHLGVTEEMFNLQELNK